MPTKAQLNAFIIARENWLRWRRIADRVTLNPHWRYPAPSLLINLERFCARQMSLYNNRAWKIHREMFPESYEFNPIVRDWVQKDLAQ